MPKSTQAALARIRKLCLVLPEVSERVSHGAPAFFVRGQKLFVMFLNDHHGDARLALWCAAPQGMQEMLVEAVPEHYFRPPYVGHRGWLGVRLDRELGWDEIADVIEDAYLTVAPRKLADALRGADAVATPPPPGSARTRPAATGGSARS